MDLGASPQCSIFGYNVFLNNYSELLNHLNFSKLMLQMYLWLGFQLFFGQNGFLHVFGVFINKNTSKSFIKSDIT